GIRLGQDFLVSELTLSPLGVVGLHASRCSVSQHPGPVAGREGVSPSLRLGCVTRTHRSAASGMPAVPAQHPPAHAKRIAVSINSMRLPCLNEWHPPPPEAGRGP